jgi:hypothetical protein
VAVMLQHPARRVAGDGYQRGIGSAGFGHFGMAWWRRSWNRRPLIGAAARFQAAIAPRRPLPDSSAFYAASLPTRLAVLRTSFRNAVRQLFAAGMDR